MAGWGLGLQLILAVLLLKTPWGTGVFGGARNFVTRLLGFTDAGASFMWGNLYRTSEDLVAYTNPEAGYFQVTDSVTGQLVPLGTVFVIHILPTIIFFSSLMALLYHLGVMQMLIRGMAWVMRKTMGTSGSETLTCAANIFVGQTEAPFVIRPYLPTMTKSELMAVMVGGFRHRGRRGDGRLCALRHRRRPSAGRQRDVRARGPGRGQDHVPRNRGLAHPRQRDPARPARIRQRAGRRRRRRRRGPEAGRQRRAPCCWPSSPWWPWSTTAWAFVGLSLQQIFGWVFSPMAWVMGVPWSEAPTFGNLLGTKIAVNEFVGYIELARPPATAAPCRPRSVVIGTYALCGFANFSSIAIQIGGIGTIAPERRSDVAALGLKAMFGGALASWLTATIAGVLVG